jgi:hypothetical protein
MMRKSLLLIAATGVALGANAQLKTAPSIVEVKTRSAERQAVALENPRLPVGPAKVAGLKTRYYNYVDHLEQVTPGVLSSTHLSAPYMWFDMNGMGVYSNGLDTINMPSFGSVLHPQWTGFNSTSTGYTKGTMVVGANNAYTVDSIWVAGYYGRPNSGTFVDTLRIAYTYGRGQNTNIPTYVWYDNPSSPFLKTHYGVDSLYAAGLAYDLAKHTMYKPSTSTGPAIMFKDILLTATDTGGHSWGIAAGLSVPAGATGTSGNLVAATFTFISGAPFVPYDTVFRGTSVNANEPFKYGMVRPYIYIEKGTAASPDWATYVTGNYNSGQYELLPETSPQSSAAYSPNWVWSTNSGANASTLQFPYVDWKISCPTCSGLSVNDITSYITVGQPYPNPANNTVSMPVTMKETSSVNATLSNIMGQVVASQNLGQLAARQSKNVTFSTANLAEGIYILTIEVNGEHMAKRVAVTH